MAEFYSARGWEIPPLPWTNLSPPFSRLAYRELDAALGVTDMGGNELVDSRIGKDGRPAMT